MIQFGISKFSAQVSDVEVAEYCTTYPVTVDLQLHFDPDPPGYLLLMRAYLLGVLQTCAAQKQTDSEE